MADGAVKRAWGVVSKETGSWWGFVHSEAHQGDVSADGSAVSSQLPCCAGWQDLELPIERAHTQAYVPRQGYI